MSETIMYTVLSNSLQLYPLISLRIKKRVITFIKPLTRKIFMNRCNVFTLNKLSLLFYGGKKTVQLIVPRFHLNLKIPTSKASLHIIRRWCYFCLAHCLPRSSVLLNLIWSAIWTLLTSACNVCSSLYITRSSVGM